MFHCHNGVTVDVDRDLGWLIHSREDLPPERTWAAGEGIELVEVIVEFEKVAQAEQFWASLSDDEKRKYCLLSLGRNICRDYDLVKYFIINEIQRTAGRQIEHTHYQGDSDIQSLTITATLETNPKWTQAEQHFGRKVVIHNVPSTMVMLRFVFTYMQLTCSNIHFQHSFSRSGF